MINQATTRCPNCFGAGPETNCKFCGWQPGLGNPPPALALGVVLDGRYRIGRVLGHGGFGITYLAWDDNLHLRLAIKEYLPRDSATRAPDGTSLSVFSGAAEEQFAYGLDRFLEEARTLARFDQHPGIVTVKNYFRAHGTGYCVMEYVEGITLRQYLDQQPGGKLGVEAAWTLLMPVMDALRAVHKDGLLHRDIAPDNIYLTQDGRVKLLDFGAARFAAGEHSKSLSVILKPGYAPEEQYRARGKQGPWTDVYGLGATLYRAITGQVPPDSLDRLDQDELVPPSRLGVAIPRAQEAHLLKALAIKAEGRWQNMEQLQANWRSGNAPLPQSVLQPAEEKPQPAVEEPPPVTTNNRTSPSKSPLRWAVLGALLLMVAPVAYFLLNKESRPVSSDNFLPSNKETMVAGTTLTEGRVAFDKGDYEAALGIFRSLAEKGDPRAQVDLGALYDEGRGVPKDYGEALRWYRTAADQGDAIGQVSLGIMYKDGNGVPKNETEASRLFRQALPRIREAAEQGDADAQLFLGIMYFEGYGLTKNVTEAKRWAQSAAENGKIHGQVWLATISVDQEHPDIDNAIITFKKLAEQGIPDAQLALGVMYLAGKGVPQDYAAAFRWLSLAAQKHLGPASYFLGIIYERGYGVTQDMDEAVRWYRLAAEQGDTDAQNSLGEMYFDGRGVKRDYAQAIRLFRDAAEQGNDEAKIKLGMMYDNGFGVNKNAAEAINLYREAASQGNAVAQNILGVKFADGIDVKQDYDEAMRLFQQAANQGYSDAQNNLGKMYFFGNGVRRDYEEARKLFKQAADEGNSDGQNSLGIIYYDGLGIKQNYGEALKLFQQAADQGNAEAQNNLAGLYEEGKGVKKNPAKAIEWYRKAAENGNTDAIDALKRLDK